MGAEKTGEKNFKEEKTNMLNKKALWKGLSSVFCFVLALSIVLGGVLEANASAIDTYLGTSSTKTWTENAENAYKYFTPSEQYLTADGKGDSKALIQAAIDLNRKQAQEGIVLLKNENNVLPLASGAKISLFGIGSHENLIGSSFGVKCWGPYISLEQALSQNKTDFKNTIATTLKTDRKTGTVSFSKTMDAWNGDEFAFDGAGYVLNPVMIEVYDKLCETYVVANNGDAQAKFQDQEPSAADIAAANPNYKDSFAQYGDAAIVYIYRGSAESKDYLPHGVAEGQGITEPFELTIDELNAIAMAKECSDKVIVLVASSASVEINELKNDPEIDSILYIGSVGNYGNLGVADVLCGKVNPSGGLFDIFTSQNMSAPAMMNMGEIFYTNTAEKITRTGGAMSFKPGAYTIEAEGIYVGYRYYETRYYDCVVGQGNANSVVGAYESKDKGAWTYADEVTYGFGFGDSYTDFTFEIVNTPSVRKDKSFLNADEYYMDFEVKVTNVGSVAGKTPVQIYAQAPYTLGGIEKSAIQLMNFEKTGIIEPGKSETVKVTIDLQYLASFDEHGKGTYVFENGDYYFAVGNGAHDALNHVLAAQGYTTANGMDYNGNAAQAYKLVVTDSVVPSDAFSISKTGEKIEVALPYADWNYYQPGEVVYLSRADWAGTYPKEYHAMTLTSQKLIDDLNGKYYTLKTTDDVSSVKWEQDNGMHISDMWGKVYTDPAWDKLLDQMTLEEAMYIFTFGGPSIPGAASIGAVEIYMTENAGNGIAVALNASKTPDAPWAIPTTDPNGFWHPEVFCSATLGASSFNPALYYELGKFVAEESLFSGINILWGPGLNTHRHAYNGRNGEYYSEDPILSGVAAMEFAIGALEKGLVAAPKHFAFNDQETQRGGVSPYMTEQRAREVELRAYQYAFEADKYDTAEFDAGMRGLMTSFSKIGAVECTASYGLMTEILIEEWNFIGYAVTDIYDDTDLWTAVLNSGTTCFDTRGQAGFLDKTFMEGNRLFKTQTNSDTLTAHLIDGDLNLQQKLKDAVHKNIYAWSVSHVMNRYTGEVHVDWQLTWWRAIYIGLEAVSAVMMVGCAALYVMSLKRKESEV